MQFIMQAKYLNENKVNYTTIKKEFLAMIFDWEKLCSCIIGSKVICIIKVFSN